MTQPEANPFYGTPLGRCILAGDINGVMDAVDAMPAAERTVALAGVRALMMDRWKLIRTPLEGSPPRPCARQSLVSRGGVG
ncbi:MAG: hypothetical protein IPH37_18070 [Burkholderiales bacterium]|nr:hypothetical protein [Burkholderiales bacterium]